MQFCTRFLPSDSRELYEEFDSVHKSRRYRYSTSRHVAMRCGGVMPPPRAWHLHLVVWSYFREHYWLYVPKYSHACSKPNMVVLPQVYTNNGKLLPENYDQFACLCVKLNCLLIVYHPGTRGSVAARSAKNNYQKKSIFAIFSVNVNFQNMARLPFWLFIWAGTRITKHHSDTFAA